MSSQGSIEGHGWVRCLVRDCQKVMVICQISYGLLEDHVKISVQLWIIRRSSLDIRLYSRGVLEAHGQTAGQILVIKRSWFDDSLVMGHQKVMDRWQVSQRFLQKFLAIDNSLVMDYQMFLVRLKYRYGLLDVLGQIEVQVWIIRCSWLD